MVFCDDLEGWDRRGREAREREDVCVSVCIMADLCCCMEETNTTL